MNETIHVHSYQPGITTLTFNRPEKCNAFDDHFIAALIERLTQIANDSSTRVLILKAQGDHFSAGADLAWMQRMASYSQAENQQDCMQLATLMQKLDQFPKPTIALVQGKTYGGGVGLVACCDFVFASEEAQFCFSEVRLGLIPAVISPYIIAAIGERAARRYFLSAEIISASRACELGLVTEIVESVELLARGQACAENLLHNSPAALTACKSLLQTVSNQPITPSLIQDTANRIAQIRSSAEGQEGLQAFLTKRKPHWDQ